MRRFRLPFGVLISLLELLLLVSCSGETRKEAFLSLTTAETLDKVLARFGKPQYAFAPYGFSSEGQAPRAGQVIAWYRVYDKECARYASDSCHVELDFKPLPVCDTRRPNCYGLKSITFPILVERKSENWLSVRMQDWREYSNPPSGSHNQEEFPQGQTMTYRTDFPEPVPELKAALGL